MANQILCLLGFFLLCAGVCSKPQTGPTGDLFKLFPSKSNKSWWNHDIRHVNIKGSPQDGVTAVRSAFQWTIGETKSNRGILNSISFTVEDSVIPKASYSGNIGIDNNGTLRGVHFWVTGADDATAGASFKCSQYFVYMDVQNACVNTNYQWINNAIYYLDVEIDATSAKGYISEPQDNLDDMENRQLPRYLIGAYKYSAGIKNLKPQYYFNLNHAENFSSYDISSEIATVNYAPDVYKEDKRHETELDNPFKFNFYKQNTILSLTSDKKIAIYLSRPAPEIY